MPHAHAPRFASLFIKNRTALYKAAFASCILVTSSANAEVGVGGVVQSGNISIAHPDANSLIVDQASQQGIIN